MCIGWEITGNYWKSMEVWCGRGGWLKVSLKGTFMKLFRKNIVWHNVMLVMNCFVVWLNDEKRLALFLAGTIVRDTHYCESPPQAGLELAQNLSSGLFQLNWAAVIITTPLRLQLFQGWDYSHRCVFLHFQIV